MTILYLYALLGDAPRGALSEGLAGERLEVVRCGDVLAAAGRLDAVPPAEELALRGHDAVVQRLGQVVDAMLPVPFGTVVPDEAALAALVAANGAQIRDALALVRGREQMVLRVYGDPQSSPEIPAVPQVPQVPAPPAVPMTFAGTNRVGGRYMTARLLARASAPTVPEIEALRAPLADFVRAERIEHHVLPPLLASVFHLVERGSGPRYAAAVAAAAAGLGAVRVAASGPQPPYAFTPEALGAGRLAH